MEQHKTSFNLLDVINTVPHFKAMFTVPVLFKATMQALSKDVDTVYQIAESLASNHKIDDATLRTLLRVVNDRKIFDFFKSNPFNYSVTSYLTTINNANEVERITLKDPIEISTEDANGLLTLKDHVENVILRRASELFPNNAFLRNLVTRSIFSNTFKEKFYYIGSNIDLSDPQYEDIMTIMRQDFQQIQDTDIEGHSLYDWLFVYDLLVNKHGLGGGSFTLLLDNNLQLDNPNSIVSKWLRYLKEYDTITPTYSQNLVEIKELPDLKDSFGRTKSNEDKYFENIDMGGDYMDMVEGMEEGYSYQETVKSSRPIWAMNPNYMPLFVSIDNYKNVPLINRTALWNVFDRGHLPIKMC